MKLRATIVIEYSLPDDTIDIDKKTLLMEEHSLITDDFDFFVDTIYNDSKIVSAIVEEVI